MEDERRRRAREICGRLVARKLEGADIGRFLDEACGEDELLRADVEAMIERHDEIGRFLDEPWGEDEPVRSDVGALIEREGDESSVPMWTEGEPAPTRELRPRDPLVGQTIGDFHIRSIIDSGGMGTVYRATQRQPRRTVALKVLKPGVASSSALRRFRYESQILARLRHPNIAQVYEAGTHDDGGQVWPYFAMEYVPNARTVVDHARAEGLATGKRLELYLKICQAVHHGHQKGIIHRDLKPANILVDPHGEPKIIDFGIARATDSDLAVTTAQTDVGQLIGTLQYMSPEQCEADPDDLDTRSDIYSLGVVLYELLCGCLPYDVTRASVVEAVRIIREERPTPPSTADLRLRGDVETIALKALEKSRERRYQSAADLARDIRHHLNDEPIEARPPSISHQIRLFTRRNRAFVLSAVVVGAILVLAMAGIVAAWQRARVERDRALYHYEQGRRLADLFMDEFHDSIRELAGTLDARELLVMTARDYLDGLEEQGSDATLRIDIARGHRLVGEMLGGPGEHLNRREEALEHFAQSRAILADLLRRDPSHSAARLDAAKSQYLIGRVLRDQDEDQRACEAFAESLRNAEHAFRDEPRNDVVKRQVTVSAMAVGDCCLREARFAEAEEHYDRVRRAREERVRDRRSDDRAMRDLTVVLLRLAACRSRLDDPDGAIALYRRALDIRRTLAARMPESARRQRDIMVVHEFIVAALRRAEATAEALQEAEAALVIARRLRALESVGQRVRLDLARVERLCGEILLDLGETEAGCRHLEAAIVSYESVEGEPSGSATTLRAIAAIRELLDEHACAGGR